MVVVAEVVVVDVVFSSALVVEVVEVVFVVSAAVVVVEVVFGDVVEVVVVVVLVTSGAVSRIQLFPPHGGSFVG